MNTVGLLTIGFGTAAPEKINNNILNYYEYILKELMGFTYHLNCRINNCDEYSIPLSLSDCEEGNSVVYEKIFKHFESIKDKVDTLIVDISTMASSLIPGPVEFHIYWAISALIVSNQQPSMFILITKQLPPLSEACYIHIMRTYVENSKIIILDEEGNCISKNDEISLSDKTRYRIVVSEAKGNISNLFKIKILRRMGHYKRISSTGIKYCVREFYDCSESEYELKILIQNWIIKNYGDDIPDILYHCEVSKWLEPPIISVSKEIGARCFHVNDIFRACETGFKYELKKPILILPLIDSANTIIGILDKWKKFEVGEIPLVLSILSTQGIKEENGEYSISYNGNINIKYILRVDRTTYYEECPLCVLDIPYTEYGDDDNLMLTTYDFWSMASSSEWIKEKDTPKIRRELEYIPNFEQLIHKNGAWLARKIKDIINYYVEWLPANPIIVVCPDEAGANALSEYLRVIDGFSIISIPKDVIFAFEQENINLNQIYKTYEHEKWHIQMSNAPKNKHIVIVEEFSVSGSTKKYLMNMIRRYGFNNILCHCAIVDFGGKGKEGSIVTYVLYEFHLKTETIGDYKTKEYS